MPCKLPSAQVAARFQVISIKVSEHISTDEQNLGGGGGGGVNNSNRENYIQHGKEKEESEHINIKKSNIRTSHKKNMKKKEAPLQPNTKIISKFNPSQADIDR